MNTEEVLKQGTDKLYYLDRLEFIVEYVIHPYRAEYKVYTPTYPSTYHPDGKECYVSGQVKWDGCMDLNWGAEGFMHICTLCDDGIELHTYILKYLHDKTAMELPKFENGCCYAEDVSNFTIIKGEFDYDKDLTF